MNKEYIYDNGRVTIIDDKGKKRDDEYYDNLDEVLIKENVIERMEKQIDELKIKKQQYEKGKTNKLFCLLPLLGGIVLSLIGPLLSVAMLSGQSVISLASDAVYIDFILSITGVVLPFGLFLGAVISTLEYLQYRQGMKKVKGIDSQIDYLQEQSKNEREQLNLLQDNKSKEKDDAKTGIVKVIDFEELRQLKRMLEQYYELGYNMNKYARYYMHGELENKLPSNIDTDLALDYIKRKKLVKKD